MEPQLIDYYCDIPNGINVIDKMNEEFLELQRENEKLKEENNKLKDKNESYEKIMKKFQMPRIKVDNVEDYQQIDIKMDEFSEFIENSLEEGKLPFPPKDGVGYYEDPYAAGDIIDNYRLKLTEALDDLTNHQNIEWCKYRIKIAIEIFEKLCELHPEEVEHSMDNIFSGIIFGAEDSWAELPNVYKELSAIYEPKWSEIGDNICLWRLCYYNCEKCGKLDDYGEPENVDNKLLCCDCRLEEIY